MTFPIKYTVNNATVNNITLNRDQANMIVNLSTADNGILNIDLPRAVIDSRDDKNLDQDFFVFADGLHVEHIQDSSNNQSRNISIDFENGVEEIEIQGTETFGVKPVVKPPITPPPPIPIQESTIPPTEVSENKASNQITSGLFESYSNYACGVNVEYPTTWTKIEATEDESDKGTIVWFTPSPPYDYAYLSISMMDVPSKRTLRGLTIQTIDNLEQIEPDFTLINSNSTNIGSHEAHQIIYTSTLESADGQKEVYKSLVAWTIEDDRAYQFTFDSSNISTFAKYLPDAYSIINSTQITTPGEDISDDYTVTC
jgi:hypothetical protein